jgi:hypothetical protein
MKQLFRLLALSSVAIFGLLLFVDGNTRAQTYSGRATGVKSTVITGIVPGVTTAVTDTGTLPAAGGSINLASASANIANVLTAGASTVNTSGSANTSQSSASIQNLDISIAGFDTDLRVRAATVASTTSCACPSGTCTGGSTITTLRIGQRGGGTVITVTGAANQTVVVTVGVVTLTLVINEQIISPSSLTVNALHATFTDTLTGVSTDVIVAQSHSDITCTVNPLVDRYSGDATGVNLGVTTAVPASQVVTIVSDTGFLPTSGGNISVTTASVNIPGVLTTGVVTSNTSGGLPGGNEDTSQSSSTVNNLNASLIGAVTISATVVQSNTLCQCGLSTVSCTGGSVVTNLAVVAGGIPVAITITGAPNQVVTLPLSLGSIIINEQLSATPGDLTVNALHVFLTPVGLASTDLVISHSHSDIQCALSPTAGGATIEGQVVDSGGRAISNVRIQMTDQDGTTWLTVTNQFGNFRLEDIPVGRTYFVEASHKRYTFGSRVVRLEENISGIDFTSEQ